MATTEPAADIATATEPKNRFVTVTLNTPIARGETTIEKLTLRKPTTGQLRGLTMKDILTTDVTAMMQLLPRISEPRLSDDDVEGLEPDDFAELTGTIRGFFMTTAEKKAVEDWIAGQKPTT